MSNEMKDPNDISAISVELSEDIIQTTPASVDDTILILEQQVQNLRLELAEQEQLLSNFQNELERQRRGERDRLTETLQNEMERMMTDAAVSVTQLLTQAHLLEKERKPISAKDVLTVAKRLVRVLEDRGLHVVSQVGEIVPFDPNYHEPLSMDTPLTAGQKVVVKLPGLEYCQKALRKAGVQPCQDA